MKRTVGLLLSLTILAIWAAFIPNAAAAEEVIKIGQPLSLMLKY